MPFPLIGALLAGAGRMAGGMLARSLASRAAPVAVKGAAGRGAVSETLHSLVPESLRRILGEAPDAGKEAAAPSLRYVAPESRKDTVRSFFRGRQVEPVKEEKFDIAKFAERLGVARPSSEQIKTERERITEVNAPRDQDKLGGFGGLLASAGAMTLGILKATIAFTGITAVVKTFGNRLADASKALAPFNTAMATIAAKREREEFRLAIKRGSMTSGTTGNLSEHMVELNRNLLPFAALGTNISNSFLTGMAFTLNRFFDWAESIGIVAAVQWANSLIGGDDEGKDTSPSQELFKWFSQPGMRTGINDNRGMMDPDVLNRRPDERPRDRM